MAKKKVNLVKYDVYYMRPEFFQNGIVGYSWLVRNGMLPDIFKLNVTHTFLRQVEGWTKEDAYMRMQGENWSPNGEARSLIQSKKLQHTSMSVGDILVDTETNCVWMVDMFGFKGLGITKPRVELQVVVNNGA